MPATSPTSPQDVPIRAAATLMVLRDGSAGLEVCLLRRNERSGWVAGVSLFPGGAVDPGDEDPALAGCCVLPPGVARPDELAGGGAPWIAALRESYEEIGLLLATDPSGAWAHEEPARARRLAAARLMVDRGERSFGSVLRDEGLVLRLDQLRFVVQITTPPGHARRYDTRFYLAPAPPHAPIEPDGTEIVGAQWVAPGWAAAEHDAGRLPMLSPTHRALQALASRASVAEAIAAAEASELVEHIRTRRDAQTPGELAEGAVARAGLSSQPQAS